MSVLLPLYLEGGTGLTAFAAGLLMLVPVLANAGTTLLGGRIMDARGEWPLLPAGFAAIAAGFALMAALAPTLSLLAAFIAALLIMGGTGFIFSPSQTAGLRTLPAEMNPFGVAISTTFVQIAACIGPSLYTGIMSTAQAGALAAGAGEALALDAESLSALLAEDAQPQPGARLVTCWRWYCAVLTGEELEPGTEVLLRLGEEQFTARVERSGEGVLLLSGTDGMDRLLGLRQVRAEIEVP